MCKSKYEIDDNEATMTEGEGEDNPFGSGADADASLRSAEGGLDGDSDHMDADANDARPVPTSCRDIPANAGEGYKVSRHYTVGSLSSRAALPHTIPSVTRKGLKRQEVICNMRHLATNCLDPLRDWCDANGYKIVVSSGFRNNTNGSDHNIGSAADLMVYQNGKRIYGRDLSRVVKIINETLKLPYTQMIHEANRIIHIACRRSGNSSTRLYWSTGYGSPVSGRGYRHRV